MNIARKYKSGGHLQEGDIVAECEIGDIIWDGAGVVETRPLGIVITYKDNHFIGMKLYTPEETECYNIVQIRTGRVRLTDKAPKWMLESMPKHEDGTVELHISRFDGKFYAWDNIERIGSIYELPD